MLIINDNACHQRTGMIGRVIGYGHQIVNDAYIPTLKVLVNQPLQSGKAHLIMEDLVSRWMPMK